MPRPPSISLAPVASSQIKSIGYDATSKTMAVQFNSGATYHYDDVPAETHSALMSAKSVGGHFHKHVLPRGFKFRKI